MPTVPKLTKRVVDAIPKVERGQQFYWETELKGFGVKSTPVGLVYVAQRRVNVKQPSGAIVSRTVRHIIGKHGEITPEIARDKAALALARMRDGEDLNAERTKDRAKAITLAEAYSEFKAERNLREKTVIVYDSAMRHFKDWLDKPITNISKDMVQARHKKISNLNSKRGKGEAQANQCMRTLRTILNYAAIKYEADGRSILPENPVQRLSQARVWNRIPRRQDVLQPHQLEPWFAEVQKLDATMRDYLILSLFTGLRRNEAAQLRWRHVDFKTKTILIPSENVKTHEEHRLPLSDYLLWLLKARYDNYKKQPVHVIDRDYVFPGNGDNPFIVEPKRSIAAVCGAKSCVDAGIKFSMHTLRRTFITIAERLDISHYALKRLMNHSNSSDVTAGYIVTDVERLREPMQMITNYIKQQAKLEADQQRQSGAEITPS